MNDRTNILNELKELAPGLVHLPVAMPYAAPQGYFEALADSLLSNVKNDEHYFTHLFSTRSMPYQVPANYFDNLAADILNKVNRTYSRSVPQGYFDTLPAILLNKVRNMEVAKELETVAPLLNTISRQPVQAVPEGYFEQLQPNINQVITRKMPVVSINKKTGWLKYAVAASIVLFLSLGAFKYFNSTSVKDDVVSIENIDKQLAQLDDATIESYLQQNQSVMEVNADLYKDVQDEDIESLLQNFTEQELQQQLQENLDLSTRKREKP